MKFETVFNNLKEYGNYKVHLAKKAGIVEPLEVLARNNGEWMYWHNTFNVRNRFSRDYVISFAHISGNRFLFGGIVKIKSRNWEDQTYEPELTEEYKELIGRLVIEYTGKNKRGTAFILENIINDFKVVELYPKRYTGEYFKSISAICHSYEKMKTIFDNDLNDWKTALSSVKGIYLLTDTKTGKLYVGSAYGDNGIWGRWSNYIYGFTGGNKGLVELLKKEGQEYFEENFQFSVLEIVGSTVSDDEIIQKENLWKDKLKTREYGYNKN